MSSKSSVAIGFSISPSHISGVRVSLKDFSVELKAEKPLPPATISHDAKRVLDQPTLVPIIRELMLDLGNPEFSTPVYLSIALPYLTTSTILLTEASSLKPILQEQVNQEEWLQGENSLLQCSLLSQQGETARVTYAVLSNELIQDYTDAFYEAGLRVASIDSIPLCVLRAMAASGVLDALLKKIGKNACWGIIGISGSQTWCMIWRGANLLHQASFTTPAEKPLWEERILECLQKSMEGEAIKIWFAWQESGALSPINPLTLKLKAPVRPALLGPFYGQQSKQLSMPALGAALKAAVPFPLGWDFLNTPETEPLKERYARIPYCNYQPFFPKLFFGVAWLVLLGVLIGSGCFWWQNRQMAQVITEQENRLQALRIQILEQNQLYPDLFGLIHEKSLSGIQIQSVKIQASGELALSGKGYRKERIEQFLKLLAIAQPGKPIEIQQNGQLILPHGTSPAFFTFEFAGKVQRIETTKKPRAKS